MAYGIKLIAVLIFICCLFNNAALAQSHENGGADAEVVTPLVVGQRVPDDFWIREHLFYVNGDTVRKTLEKYKDKMIVLGFWATWCSSCLKNSEMIEAFVEARPDMLGFVKVNPIRSKDDIPKIEQLLDGSLGRSYGLERENFSSIIGDWYLQELFPSIGFPNYIWINKGTVQVMTYLNLFSDTVFSRFMERDEP